MKNLALLSRKKLPIGISILALALAIAIALVYQFDRADPSIQKKLTPPVKLTLGMGASPANASLFLAKRLGFFLDEGLDLNLQLYPSGQLSFADLLAGKLDLAISADIPIVLAALRGANFHVVATTFESSNFSTMIGRRDRGIKKPEDLSGKKLATVFGTTAEFMQDTFLAAHRIDPRTITRVNLAPGRTVDALVSGEVDAVTIWAPYSRELIKRLGDAATVFSDDNIYSTTINLVAGERLIAQHPEVLRGVLAALVRGTDFARSRPERAVREVAAALELDEATIQAQWDPQNFTVALNHSLIGLLEEQARWAIRRRMVDATAVPNFLNWLHTDALSAVKPVAVGVTK